MASLKVVSKADVSSVFDEKQFIAKNSNEGHSEKFNSNNRNQDQDNRRKQMWDYYKEKYGA